MAPAKSNRRARYIVENAFQVQFIMKFCMLVVLGGVFTIALLYAFGSRSTTVAIANSRVIVRSTSDFILPVLIQTVAIVVVLVGAVTYSMTLLFTHRIAGPLYRMKKVAGELCKGDFSSGFKLRAHDQVKDVAENLNQAIKNNREKLSDAKIKAAQLLLKLERFPVNVVSAEYREAVSLIKETAGELNESLGFFKT